MVIETWLLKGPNIFAAEINFFIFMTCKLLLLKIKKNSFKLKIIHFMMIFIMIILVIIQN